MKNSTGFGQINDDFGSLNQCAKRHLGTVHLQPIAGMQRRERRIASLDAGDRHHRVLGLFRRRFGGLAMAFAARMASNFGRLTNLAALMRRVIDATHQLHA